MFGKIAGAFKRDPNKKPRNYNPNPPFIPHQNNYTNKPETIDEQFSDMVNLVASWLSAFNGRVTRINNGVVMTAEGEFRDGTLDFNYRLEANFDAKTHTLRMTGLIKCHDLYMMESFRKVYIYEDTPEGIYRSLNNVYLETAYNVKEVKKS